MNKSTIPILLLASQLVQTDLTREFLLRLRQASASIQNDALDFYQKACTFAETSQTKYD